MRKGTLYVFTGPSGAGKGTVLGRLVKADDRLFFSISATTRAPRPGEQDGVHYYFLENQTQLLYKDYDKIYRRVHNFGLDNEKGVK